MTLTSQRIPSAASTEPQDPSVALSAASNAASVAVAELVAVANVFGVGDQVRRFRSLRTRSRLLTKALTQDLAASTLVRVAHKSGVIPLSSIVPVHQLVSWPKDSSSGSSPSPVPSSLSLNRSSFSAVTRAKPSVEFKTLLTWNEHLALGLGDVRTLESSLIASQLTLSRRHPRLRQQTSSGRRFFERSWLFGTIDCISLSCASTDAYLLALA
jgi:hypothetical protein